MSELDPRTDPHGYAYAFTNVTAPELAREALSWVTDEYSAEEWAHETADSMAAVIYTGQAVALYAAGIITDEDDDVAAVGLQGEGMSATERIDQAITALSYVWHRRVLSEAVTAALWELRSSTSGADLRQVTTY